MDKQSIDFDEADKRNTEHFTEQQREILDGALEAVLKSAAHENEDPAVMALLALGSVLGSAYEKLDTVSFIDFIMGFVSRIGTHPRAKALVEANPERFYHAEASPVAMKQDQKFVEEAKQKLRELLGKIDVALPEGP